MSSELKPCPFCGGEVHLFKDNWDKCGAYCKECLATVGVHLSKGWRAMLANREEAIAAWNRRANIDSCENELIVRCENCKHYNRTGCSDGFGWCERMDRGTNDDFYCSLAEMKEKAARRVAAREAAEKKKA